MIDDWHVIPRPVPGLTGNGADDSFHRLGKLALELLNLGDGGAIVVVAHGSAPHEERRNHRPRLANSQLRDRRAVWAHGPAEFAVDYGPDWSTIAIARCPPAHQVKRET